MLDDRTIDPLAHCGSLAAAFDGTDYGRWVTIGAVDHHGGTPVFIKDGVITKGAPSLAGRRIDALKEDASDLGSHRAQLKASREHARAQWGKEARKLGHKPEHLHQLAAEMSAHDKAGVEAKTRGLQDARKTIESYGGDWRSASLRAAHGGDVNRRSAANRGYDLAADTLARQHPELFPEQNSTHNTDRLFELLAAGNPVPMSEDSAYEQALEQLRQYAPGKVERARKAKAAAYDEVPFAADLSRCGRFAGPLPSQRGTPGQR